MLWNYKWRAKDTKDDPDWNNCIKSKGKVWTVPEDEKCGMTEAFGAPNLLNHPLVETMLRGDVNEVAYPSEWEF